MKTNHKTRTDNSLEAEVNTQVNSTATLEQYLQRSGLPPATKAALIEEAKCGNPDEVLQKAVKLSGRKAMTKVSSFNHK